MYASKRMAHKFLPVMHLVSKFVHEQQQRQQLAMDEGEPPQFREPPADTPGNSHTAFLTPFSWDNSGRRPQRPY